MYYSYNTLYTVYNVHCSTAGGEIDYYFYVTFKNIVVKTDGTNEIYDIYDVTYPNGSYFFGSANGPVVTVGSGDSLRWVSGYTDIQSLYNDAIRPMSQYYNCEDNID